MWYIHLSTRRGWFSSQYSPDQTCGSTGGFSALRGFDWSDLSSFSPPLVWEPTQRVDEHESDLGRVGPSSTLTLSHSDVSSNSLLRWIILKMLLQYYLFQRTNWYSKFYNYSNTVYFMITFEDDDAVTCGKILIVVANQVPTLFLLLQSSTVGFCSFLVMVSVRVSRLETLCRAALRALSILPASDWLTGVSDDTSAPTRFYMAEFKQGC